MLGDPKARSLVGQEDRMSGGQENRPEPQQVMSALLPDVRDGQAGSPGNIIILLIYPTLNPETD